MTYLIVFGCVTGIPFCVSANPLRFDFSGTTAVENGVEIQGADSGSLPEAVVTFGDIPTASAFEGATDGRGAIINADPGEGVRILFDSIETSRAAFARCSIRTSHASTAITLASIDQGPDGFVATNSPNIATSFVEYCHIICEPLPSHGLVTYSTVKRISYRA
jgi:hypothetical protein